MPEVYVFFDKILFLMETPVSFKNLTFVGKHNKKQQG